MQMKYNLLTFTIAALKNLYFQALDYSAGFNGGNDLGMQTHPALPAISS